MTKIRYRKKISKVLATVMSVSMLMSSVTITSFATEAEGTKENPTVTVTVTEVSDPEAGTDTTITVTEKNWYEQEAHIQESETFEEEPAEQESESYEEELTEQESESYEEESEASEQESEPYYEEEESEAYVESVTTGQTTIEGSETTTEQVVTNENGQVIEESTEIEGQEKTIVESTTTETQTEIQKEIESSVDPETGDQTIVTEQTTNDPEYTEWQETGTETDSKWVKDEEKSSDGDPTIVDSEAETSKTTEIEFDDPLDDQDITLNLKPGGKDEEKVYISVEDLVNSNLNIPESRSYTDENGNQVEIVVTEQKNRDGDVIGYSVVTTTTNVDTNTTTGETYEGETTESSEVIAPSGYTEGISEPFPVYDEAGNEIGYEVTETKAIKDDSGNVIGYEIIKTTTKTQVESGETMLDGEQSSTENTDMSFTLPTRPEESVTTDETTGETTTVTVEDLTDGAGNVIGYKSTTVKTDADGKELLKSSETLYGTSTTVKTTTTTDITNKTQFTTTTTETTIVETTTIKAELEKRETELKTDKTTVVETTVLTEEDVYQLVETENGTYFLYKGEMYEVKAVGSHGSVDMESLDVNMGLEPSGKYQGRVDETNDLLKQDPFYNYWNKKEGFEYQYLDYGLASSIMIDQGRNDGMVTQFVLVDSDGNEHYVLCADYSTSAVHGASYNMVNVDDAEYFKYDGDNFNEAPYIRAIALNGYWGTEDGIGSLDNVIQVLKDAKEKGLINLSDDEIENITPGEALAATQAALWFYGDSSSNHVRPKTDVVGDVYTDDFSRNADAYERATVNALYTALVNLDPSDVEDNTTELITKDNFASSASIVIKDNAENEDGTTKTDSQGNELYNADLSFTIEMVPSAIKGNMVVTVKDQNGNEIATKIIAGENKEEAKTDIEGNAVYTFENLELAEGVELTLNLHGTQTLDQGVYLYTAQVYSNSQTFIGVAEGTRNVNLSVDMKFEVVEANASVKESSKSQTTYEKDVTVETMTDVRTEERTKTTETNQSTTEIDAATETRVYADVTVTETTETKTQSKREWNSYQKNEYTYEPDPDNGEGEPEVPTDPGSDDDKPEVPTDPGSDDVKPEVPTDPGNDDVKPEVPADPGSNDSDDNDYRYDWNDDDDQDEPTGGSVSVLGAVEDDTVLITDEEVPLGNMTLQVLPMTGDNSFVWMLLSLLSGFGLAGMSLTGKRRKEEE